MTKKKKIAIGIGSTVIMIAGTIVHIVGEENPITFAIGLALLGIGFVGLIISAFKK